MNFGLFVMMMGLAHVSCGNSRVRAAGICISTAVNIQFSPTSACCPAEWGEKGAVGSRDLCWLGGEGGGRGIVGALGPPHVDIKWHT